MHGDECVCCEGPKFQTACIVFARSFPLNCYLAGPSNTDCQGRVIHRKREIQNAEELSGVDEISRTVQAGDNIPIITFSCNVF